MSGTIHRSQRFRSRMIDLVRATLLGLALVAAARARVAVAPSSLCALLFVAECTMPFLFPETTFSGEIALASVFMGPSGLPSRTHALGDVLADPIHHVVPAAIATFGARSAFRRAEPLHPDTPAARAFDRAGLRLVALAVMYGLLALSGVVVRLITLGR